MSKNKRDAHRRAERAAAALRQEQQRRKRLWTAGSAIGLVALVVVVLVVVKVAVGPRQVESQQTSSLASPQLASTVTGVPASTLDTVGAGTVSSLPRKLDGQPALTSNGKPLVVYVGAEYCPFCAAQRWAMVVALSRFGTFTNLGATRSASDDVYPNTPTLSFHGATYSSQYLEFQGVELQSNIRQGRTYATLDVPTSQQQQLLEAYNAPPYVAGDSAGSIPFIDFGNKYLLSGASVSPQLLAGRSQQDVANALADPGNDIARAVNGSANAFTTVLCDLTGGQPGDVCTSAAATAYDGKL